MESIVERGLDCYQMNDRFRKSVVNVGCIVGAWYVVMFSAYFGLLIFRLTPPLFLERLLLVTVFGSPLAFVMSVTTLILLARIPGGVSHEALRYKTLYASVVMNGLFLLMALCVSRMTGLGG